MIKISKSIQIFGLDLHSFWMDLKLALSEMLNWPFFRIFRVEIPVALLDENGHQLIYKNILAAPVVGEARRLKRIKFHAVDLPQNLILEHVFSLPQLDHAFQKNAIKLEVQRISPFSADQTLWVQSPASLSLDTKIRILLTSKSLVKDYLDSLEKDKKLTIHPTQYEVWIKNAIRHPVVLIGFGEGKRFRYQRIYQSFAGILLFVVLTLLCAHLLTPTLQLRLRAIDAEKKYAELRTRAAPLLQHREALLKAKDQLVSIRQIGGNPGSILEAFELITNALPDDTYLQSLQILPSELEEKIKVSMSGQTNNAAELMQRLGEHPSLRDVKAPIAATKPPGASKESFSIEFLRVPSGPAEIGAQK